MATAATTSSRSRPAPEEPSRIRFQRPSSPRRRRTVVHKKFYADKANPDMLHDEVTTIDHALTRPWTVVKN